MDRSDLSDTEPIPAPDAFLLEPDSESVDAFDHEQISDFIQAYNDDPSQYNNKKPIDLIHPGWIRSDGFGLSVATKLISVELFQFIIDAGIVVDEITNDQFLESCFWQGDDESPFSSYTFTKYLFNIFPNRINLVPPSIILSFLTGSHYGLDSDVLQLFWDNCPSLRDPFFLNSKIRLPQEFMLMFVIERQTMIGLISRCMDTGGYHGDLSSREFEGGYKMPFWENHIINFLTSAQGSVSVLRLFIENSAISLKPLHHAINPVSDTQNGLIWFEGIINCIQRIFSIPHPPPPAEYIVWYLNWWKNDVLGDVISVQQFKSIVYDFFIKSYSSYWGLILPLVQYFGDDFFSTLSSNKILSFINDILIREACPSTSSSNPDLTALVISTFLSFPSIVRSIKHHCIYFTRAFLYRVGMWGCAELFLKAGGLTMEQIWSDQSDVNLNDIGTGTKNIEASINLNNWTGNKNDDNQIGNAFTLRTLISSPFNRNRFWLASNFVNWLSYQPGTQEQLIKMIQSQQPLSCIGWTDVPEPLRRLFLFMQFSHQQSAQQASLRLRGLQPSSSSPPPPPPPPPQQQNSSTSQILQSLSWLQSLIVYAPIDYMNVKVTMKVWNTPNDGLRRPKHCDFVKPDALISLPHIPVLIDELYEDDTAIFLEDIIQGVIAALFIHDNE